MKKEKCDFNFQHYNQIMKLAKEQGYKFCFFSEPPDKKTKKIYMRHDVDLSLEQALRLAQIERRNKVVSTFFIRFDAPFFNILDPVNRKTIKEISKLGHQIGFHIDENLINGQRLSKKNIEREIFCQTQVFEDYFGIRFGAKKVVSFHRPSHAVINKNFNSDIFTSVYSPQFFSKIKYLSDSKGRWREGCICKPLKSSSFPRNLQLLIHPVWWGRKHRDPNKNLTGYLKERVKYLDESLAQDSSVYQRGSLYKVIKK